MAKILSSDISTEFKNTNNLSDIIEGENIKYRKVLVNESKTSDKESSLFDVIKYYVLENNEDASGLCVLTLDSAKKDWYIKRFEECNINGIVVKSILDMAKDIIELIKNNSLYFNFIKNGKKLDRKEYFGIEQGTEDMSDDEIYIKARNILSDTEVLGAIYRINDSSFSKNTKENQELICKFGHVLFSKNIGSINNGEYTKNINAVFVDDIDKLDYSQLKFILELVKLENATTSLNSKSRYNFGFFLFGDMVRAYKICSINADYNEDSWCFSNFYNELLTIKYVLMNKPSDFERYDLERVFSKEGNANDDFIKLKKGSRVFVNGGPGTGKTYSLIERIKHLVDIEKVNPESIFAISFTHATVVEIEARLRKEGIYNVSIMTLDALANRVLRIACREYDEYKEYENLLTIDNKDKSIFGKRIKIVAQVFEKYGDDFFNKNGRKLFGEISEFFIDEVQDIVNDKAVLLSKIICQLEKQPSVGIHLIGDFCQAIYDYDTKEDDICLSTDVKKDSISLLRDITRLGFNKIELIEEHRGFSGIKVDEEHSMSTYISMYRNSLSKYIYNKVIEDASEVDALNVIEAKENVIKQINNISSNSIEMAYKAGDRVCFLSRKNNDVGYVSSELSKNNIFHGISSGKAENIDEDTYSFLRDDLLINVATVHKAKGHEYDWVILDSSMLETKDIEGLLVIYVALTRAKKGIVKASRDEFIMLASNIYKDYKPDCSIMDNRGIDMKSEYEMSMFLQRYFYPRFAEALKEQTNCEKIDFIKCDDVNNQLNGIDVIMQADKKNVNIDEKAALYWINKDLSTFAFEIESMVKSSKQYVPGWFIDDNKKTDYYLLIWTKAIHNDVKSLTRDDFISAEVMFINKKKLQNKIYEMKSNEDKQLEKTYLIEYAKLYREKYMASKEVETEPINKDCTLKFSYVGERIEKPVNILVDKSILCDVADAHIEFGRNDYNIKKLSLNTI